MHILLEKLVPFSSGAIGDFCGLWRNALKVEVRNDGSYFGGGGFSVGIGGAATFQGGYYIQTTGNTILYTPPGFDGYSLIPTSVYGSDLTITFDTPISDFSILLAPQELACDSSATLRATAYLGSTLVGHNDSVAAQAGTWPSETLTYSNPLGFDKVVVHYQSPPPTGGDYGVIFVADNLNVTAAAVPEAGSLGVLAVGVVGLMRRKRLR